MQSNIYFHLNSRYQSLNIVRSFQSIPNATLIDLTRIAAMEYSTPSSNILDSTTTESSSLQIRVLCFVITSHQYFETVSLHLKGHA